MERIASQRADRQNRFVIAGVDVFAGRWMAATVVILMLVVGVGLYGWWKGIRPESLAALGYPGVFLTMLISGAGTFMPFPGQATILAAGALWNPLLVGLAAGLGNSTGELFGYAAGRAGAEALAGRKRVHLWRVLQSWLARHGFLTILITALVPNPIFDIVGLLAGSVSYPMRRFWVACAVGNSIKYVGMAYLGEVVSGLLG